MDCSLDRLSRGIVGIEYDERTSKQDILINAILWTGIAHRCRQPRH